MRILLVTFYVAVLSSIAVAQQSAAQSTAERYAREIITYSNSGDRARYRKFVEANFSKGMLERPIQQHLGFMSSMHDQTRGWEYANVQDWNPNEVVVLVKSKLTGSMDALLIRVEPEIPYKISGIGLRPPKGDPNALPTKLTNDQAVKELETAPAGLLP